MSMVGCFLLVDREVIDKVLSGELRTIAAALDPVSGRGLASRFSANEMEEAEIYPGGQPGGWADVDPASDSFSYFSGAFDELKALIRRGAARELGMLAWLT